ncbi:MAG TPA: glycogen/starch synthase [Syntrophales bacterium]|nr:glycogen/starch synthase [Syntrophales bacterium]
MKKKTKTGVLIISPETGRLPKNMGPLARYISGKSGGMGEVIAALCEGLGKRGIDCHLATLNLKKRFQHECHLDEESWQSISHRLDPKRIHLVSSAVLSGLESAYEGDPLHNAALFQRHIVNSVIGNVRAKYRGKLIIHSHDWMAGGVITAYSKRWGCPVLHTVHNIHTGLIAPDLLYGVEMKPLHRYLYYGNGNGDGKHCIDSHATAIKNADLVSFVGSCFLKEIVDGSFAENSIFSPAIRQEIKEKYRHGATLAIINAPSPKLYPERSGNLVAPYGPDDDIMAAKRENLAAFQQRAGLNVNPEAILFYWPSRLDPTQKGIHLLEDIAQRFVIDHGDAQIAIIGDGVGNDRIHEEICGRIAWSSGGKIVYHRFSEPLSMLGFAAASDVFGASLYEPCGQIDQIGNLYGATATNRDTGGYRDKIQELTLAIDGAAQGSGNGFLFRDYDTGGLWYGLHKSVEFHRRPAEVREKQLRRIMKEVRQKHSMDRMIDEYIAAYERINGGVPLM